MSGPVSLSTFAFLLLLAGSSLAAELREQSDEEHAEAFRRYRRQYGRGYEEGSEEYRQRLALFVQRSSEVEAQNSRPGRLWTAGLNDLADRSEAELGQLRGWRGGIAPGAGGGASGLPQSFGGGSGTFLSQRGRAKPLPQEWLDWAKLKSAHSADQGHCGSCWAVTAGGVLRMHAEIYSPGSNRTFSAQELVSCVPNPHECGGSGGCKGATVELAYHWVQTQGLAQESETPYEASDAQCKKVAGEGGSSIFLRASGLTDDKDVAAVGVHSAPQGSPAAAFGMVGFERLPENGYAALLRAVVERGPVAISAAARPWALYAGGVFDGCGSDWVVDHAVSLIGYGKDRLSGELFYLLQNSWGPSWGEGGRIRILRQESDGEQCGVDKQPLMGTGCKGGPREVRVCGPCGILYDSVVPHFKRLTP